MVLCRPLVSDRVSFELSQEAVEALRAKLVSTPGFGAFGQQQQQQQQQQQCQPHHPQPQHGRPPPAPSVQDPNEAEFRRWKVGLSCSGWRSYSVHTSVEGRSSVVFRGGARVRVEHALRPFCTDSSTATCGHQHQVCSVRWSSAACRHSTLACWSALTASLHMHGASASRCFSTTTVRVGYLLRWCRWCL
jgi:hypothetical protein